MDLCVVLLLPNIKYHFLHELLSYPTVLILSRFALGAFGCRVYENISCKLKEKNNFRSLFREFKQLCLLTNEFIIS